MAAARALLLLALLTVAPDVATAQSQNAVPPQVVTPPSQDVVTPGVVTPRTPPPSRIRSAPDIVLPTPPSPALRPVQTFTIRPSIVFSEEYTDNFNRSDDAKISNLRSTIGPGFFVHVDRGPLTAQAGYTLSVHHDTSDEQIGYFNSFIGSASWEATPRLRVNAGYVLSQSDRPEEADRLNLRQDRRTFTSNIFSLDAAYGLGTAEVRPHYRLSDFSSSDETTLAHTIGLDNSVAVDAIHTLVAGYSYLHSETTRERSRSVLGQSGSSKVSGHEVNATVMRDVSPRATAGLSGAFAARQQTSPLRDSDFTRWNLSLFTNYSLPQRLETRSTIGVSQLNGKFSSGTPLLTTFSSLSYWFGPAVAGLVVERGFSETFAEGENFGVVESTGVSASLTYPFTPLLRGALGASYRQNKFTGEGDPDITGLGGGGGNGREDTTLAGTASLYLQMLRWLSSSLDYAHTELSSTERTRSYTENRITLRLHASF
jgi:hypothetical protein